MIIHIIIIKYDVHGVVLFGKNGFVERINSRLRTIIGMICLIICNRFNDPVGFHTFFFKEECLFVSAVIVWQCSISEVSNEFLGISAQPNHIITYIIQ